MPGVSGINLHRTDLVCREKGLHGGAMSVEGGWEVPFLIFTGSETTLLDYQGPSLPAKSVQILGTRRGKMRGKGVEGPLWVGKDKLDGWIILVKGGGGANILGINFLSQFKVDLSKGKLYCAAASESEVIEGVPKSVKCQSKSKSETGVVNEEYEVVPGRDPLFPSQCPYGTEAQKGHKAAQGVQ